MKAILIIMLITYQIIGKESIIMAVPKKRTSKAKRNMRRAHDSISAPNIIVEADGTVRRPHRVNLETGVYRGRQVIQAETDTE